MAYRYFSKFMEMEFTDTDGTRYEYVKSEAHRTVSTGVVRTYHKYKTISSNKISEPKTNFVQAPEVKNTTLW